MEQPAEYTRQQFLRMEDDLDEKFYRKNGEKMTREEFDGILQSCGMPTSTNANLWSLYQQGKTLHVLDNIIYQTHQGNGNYFAYNGKKYQLASLGYMTFFRMLHNKKHQNQVLHIIMRQKKA